MDTASPEPTLREQVVYLREDLTKLRAEFGDLYDAVHELHLRVGYDFKPGLAREKKGY